MPLRIEPGIERLRRAPVRRLGDVGAQHDAARRRRRRLDVVAIGADIADMREGEGDDLAGIGGIGDDLLIAGHAGVEADLADAQCPAAPRPRPQKTLPSARTRAAVAPGGRADGGGAAVMRACGSSDWRAVRLRQNAPLGAIRRRGGPAIGLSRGHSPRRSAVKPAPAANSVEFKRLQTPPRIAREPVDRGTFAATRMVRRRTRCCASASTKP